MRGPRLEAEIVPGGADWQYVRANGLWGWSARYSIRTRDGVEIAITNRGLRRASREIMDRMSRGEPVDPALGYSALCRCSRRPPAPMRG